MATLNTCNQEQLAHKTTRHKFLSKWNILFDKNPTEWISFKPEINLKVFPCYACRDMFSSKSSFEDHVNRRAILLKYFCSECGGMNLVFYNRCAFLLHVRSHFSLNIGKIDLNRLEFYTLPFGMAGFLPLDNVPRLYCDSPIAAEETHYINTQFYSPNENDKGNRMVTLHPKDLVFASPNKDSLLALQQICTNIPMCKFILLEQQKEFRNNVSEENVIQGSNVNSVSVKEEPMDTEPEFQLPIISKIESLNEQVDGENQYVKCPECGGDYPRYELASHFTGKNAPFNENLKCYCKYVASTKCSLSAHIRTHRTAFPFVCPECGKEFKSSNELHGHMLDVCYHLSKQIRIRCPGKKCGKLFASTCTFGNHFAIHIENWIQCSVCKKYFSNMVNYADHAEAHDRKCVPDRVYNCNACKENSIISDQNRLQHIDFHVKDRSRYMYIYICKYCRNYFRSTATYKAHLMKCVKAQKTQTQPVVKKADFAFVIDNCKFCNSRIIFYNNELTCVCSNCKQLNVLNRLSNVESACNEELCTDVNVCILCDKELDDKETETHPPQCKYNKPVVQISFEEKEMCDKYEPIFSSSDDRSDSSPLGKNGSPKATDSPRAPEAKKKRKRFGMNNSRIKKPTVFTPEPQPDPQAEKPIPFDGTYYCKLCTFSDTNRGKFHEHIVTHRDISTAYQCMECGECFVVKPSLTKHLLHFHKIYDVSCYLENNNCYDKDAVEELQQVMKLAPDETREPISENQCRVCLEQFDDSDELKIHFRKHGMAFLMKLS